MIRPYREEDAPGVIALWQRVFGDSEGYIQKFLRQLPAIGVGAVAWENGIAAMAFVLLTEKPKIGYLYAVATAPEYRGRGYGQAVCRKAAELSRMPKLCTLPAEEGLAQWYDAMLDLPERVGMSEREIPGKAGAPAKKIDAEQYRRFREEYRPEAVQFPMGWYDVLEALCVSCGGGLYRAGNTVLAAYREENRCVIHDWAGAQPEKAAASLAFQLGAERAKLRVPDANGEITLCASAHALEKKTWFGLTLD